MFIRKSEFKTVPYEADEIQLVTDTMANNLLLQLEYQGSGWRVVKPYAFHYSNDGNLLIVCKKETGEIRTYRLDRIQELKVDDSLLQADVDNNNLNIQLKNIDGIDDPDDKSFTDNSVQNALDNNINVPNKAKPEDFSLPTPVDLNEILTISEQEEGSKEVLPYDDAIALFDDEIENNNVSDDMENVNSDLTELDENIDELAEDIAEQETSEETFEETTESDDFDFDLDSDEIDDTEDSEEPEETEEPDEFEDSDEDISDDESDSDEEIDFDFDLEE